jgi:hypothetical protein
LLSALVLSGAALDVAGPADAADAGDVADAEDGAAAARSGGFPAHQVIVVNELIAVVDEQIRGGVLYADTDDGLGVLAQLADQGREIGVAAQDDKGIDVPFGVAQIECVDDHADVGGILSGLADMGNFDEFKGRFVQAAFEVFVAVEIAVGFFYHDMALQEQAFQHFFDVEAWVFGIARAQSDILEIEKNGHGGVGRFGCHWIRVYSVRTSCS